MNGSAWHAIRTIKIAGFSYTEVLIATFLIAIALVPALESLYSGIQGSDIHAALSDQHFRLIGKLEQVLARPFGELQQEADAAGGPSIIVGDYSDAAGSDARRLVYLARYDGDNADNDNDPFSGVDQGLLWVKVQIEATDRVIETLIHQ